MTSRYVCNTMRHLTLLAFPVLAIGSMVFATSGASAQTRTAATSAPTAAEIERDLVLDVKRVSPAVIKPNTSIKLDVSLRNRSKQRTHHVVKPGDGSTVGWREPHVFYTAEINTGNGQWAPVPAATVGRCGLFDPDWSKDVTSLKPGKSLKLKSWIGSPDMSLQLDQPGKVRIVVHYAYRPSRTKKSGQVKLTGPIAQVPDYELVSKPIEIRIKN